MGGTRQGAIKRINELENFPQFLSLALHSNSTPLHANPAHTLSHDTPESPPGPGKRSLHEEDVYTEFHVETP